MKLAAMEGLYEGSESADLVVFSFLKKADNPENRGDKEHVMKIQFPGLLSYLAYRDFDAFVPGVKDLIDGNPGQGIPPVSELQHSRITRHIKMPVMLLRPKKHVRYLMLTSNILDTDISMMT